MLRKLCVLLSLFVLTLAAFAQDSRHFTFHYAFTVKNLPAGEKGSHLDSRGAIGCVSGSENRLGQG